ncbi:hypothetical protein [Nocardioides jiangxiensis]|uniref:Flp pilus-assembly TadG-like N-terminal domain-containing protein n=1 Tax=Nocardioides jiangxiensis TaxID=3064524 RepID=A0ABT9B306_9ACTN|nr:hypothetical protein [Nocardioides sp. WY-20]MDO7869199.1 hypothetical protein [Nocardioides sp. WY-20]
MAVFTALLISTVLVGATSFTVDIGYQRMARRDMQAVADVVAMDMARRLDGSTSSVLKSNAAWQSALSASLARQGSTVGAALSVTTCTAAAVASASARLSTTGICAYPGILNADGTFSDSGSAAATHVKVLTRTSVDYFLPVFSSSGSVARSAVASSQKTACFRLGSFAARINTYSSVLGPLLDKAFGVNLSVLSYQGLARGNVSLLDLATQLGLGSVDALATTNVTFGSLINATAAILTKNAGDPDAAASLTVLQQLNAAAGLSTTVNLGKLFSLTDSSTAAKQATVNVLDLISGAAFVANGSNALAIPLSISLPGMTNVTANVKVIEPPKMACGAVGKARARTAQIQIDVTGKHTTTVLALVTTTVDITMSLKVAWAEGLLTDAVCGAGTSVSPYGIDVLTTSGLATLDLGLVAKTITLAGLLPDVNASVGVSVVASGGSQTAQVRVPPKDFNTPVETGAGSIGLAGKGSTSTITSDVPLIGQTGSAVVNYVLNTVLGPVVSALDTQVLTPVTEAFGVNLSGADVYISPPPPNCSSPRLVG